MHLNPALTRHPRIITQSVTKRAAARSSTSSAQAAAEIYAYIAARDLALAEAERQPSDLILNRAFLANQLVDSCLKPARSPYQAQALADAEAMRERQRCERAKLRIAHLRAGTASAFSTARSPRRILRSKRRLPASTHHCCASVFAGFRQKISLALKFYYSRAQQ